MSADGAGGDEDGKPLYSEANIVKRLNQPTVTKSGCLGVIVEGEELYYPLCRSATSPPLRGRGF